MSSDKRYSPINRVKRNKELTFQDDIPLNFGTDKDFAIDYDSAADQLQINFGAGQDVAFLEAATEVFRIDGGDNFAGTRAGWSLRVYDATNTDFVSIAHGGSSVNVQNTGTTGDWNLTGIGGNFWIRDGAGLKISDSADTSFIVMSSDGTDFTIADTGHAFLKIDSIALWLEAATPQIHFYESDQATNEKMWEMLTSAADFTLRTRTDADGAGITAFQFNRGTGTALGSTTIRAETNFQFEKGSDSVEKLRLDIDNTRLWVRDGFDLRISDAGDTDFVEIAHDGADTNYVHTNTTNADFTGANNYLFDGLIDTLYMRPQVVTSTNLNDITHAVNTSNGKKNGVMVYNTTTDMPVWAISNTDGAVWKDAQGNTVHTPV
jgi:hypothetical protein